MIPKPTSLKTLAFTPDSGDVKTTRTRIEVQNARVVQLDNLLSPLECRYLLEKGEELTFENIEHEYPKEYRNNERLLFTSEAFTATIWNRMITLISNDMKGVRPIGVANEGVWEPRSLNPVWRFCKYTKGGKFAPHFDGSHVNFPNERSIFTLIVYLNDDFKGGDTQFLESKESLTSFIKGDVDLGKVKISKEVKPKQGSAIVFNHDVLHQGTEVTEGVKYILRADIVFRLVDGAIPEMSLAMNSEEYKKTTDFYLLSEKLEKLGDSSGSTEAYLKGLEIQAPVASMSIAPISQTSINDLLDDVLFYIFQFLCNPPYKEYFKLCLVCHRWERLLKHNRIWIEKCRDKNPLVVILQSKIFKGTGSQSWLSSYRETSQLISEKDFEQQKSAREEVYWKERQSNKYKRDRDARVRNWEQQATYEEYCRQVAGLSCTKYSCDEFNNLNASAKYYIFENAIAARLRHEQDQKMEEWMSSLFAHRHLIFHFDCDDSHIKWADSSSVRSFPTFAVNRGSWSHSSLSYYRLYGPAYFGGCSFGSDDNYCALLKNGEIMEPELMRGLLDACWEANRTHATNSPLMIIYPPIMSESDLSTLVTLAFEFYVPQLSLINSATASIFSTGLLTGLALFVGLCVSWAAVVIDGVVSFTIANHYGDIEQENMTNPTEALPDLPALFKEASALILEALKAVKDSAIIPSLLENITIYGSGIEAGDEIDEDLILSATRRQYQGLPIKLKMGFPLEGASALCLCPQFSSSKYVLDKAKHGPLLKIPQLHEFSFNSPNITHHDKQNLNKQRVLALFEGDSTLDLDDD